MTPRALPWVVIAPVAVIAVPLTVALAGRAIAWLRHASGPPLRPPPPCAEVGLLALLLFVLAGSVATPIAAWLRGSAAPTTAETTEPDTGSADAAAPLGSPDRGRHQAAPPTTASLRAALLVTNALNLLLVAVVLAFAWYWHGLSPRTLGVAPAGGLRPYVFAIAILFAVTPTYFAASLLNQKIIDLAGFAQHQVYVDRLLQDHAFRSSPAVVFAIVLLVPLLEETIFRGFIQRAIRALAPRGLAILLAAGLFASVHDPQSALPVFVVGIALGVIAEHTGSVLPGTLAHALFNGQMMIYIARGAGAG